MFITGYSMVTFLGLLLKLGERPFRLGFIVY
jgi:hypothetical protein